MADIKKPTLEELANAFTTWEQVKAGIKEDPYNPQLNEILANGVIAPDTPKREEAFQKFYGEESPIRKRNFANALYENAEKQFSEEMDSQYQNLLERIDENALIGLLGLVPTPKTEDKKLSEIAKAISMSKKGQEVRKNGDFDEMEEWGFNNLYSKKYGDELEKIAKKYGANSELILRGYAEDLEGQRKLGYAITKEIEKDGKRERVLDKNLIINYIRTAAPELKGEQKLNFYKAVYGLAYAKGRK